jgi:hypothetical protein
LTEMFVESGDCAGMVERLDRPFIVSLKAAVPGCGYRYDHVHCQWVAHCEAEHNISVDLSVPKKWISS